MLTSEQILSIKEILSTHSPSGYEQQAVEWMRRQVSSYCRTDTDSMGNFYMYVGSEYENSLKVMITAHADEVGFQIIDIDKKGYVYVRKVGGADSQTIPGTAVVAITKRGEIEGVFGKKPPHILSGMERDKTPGLSDIWVDFGFDSQKEALEYINYGDYITAKSSQFITNNGKKIISKALDNKISLFILEEVVKYISCNNLPIQVVGVATAQEELGCRGSIVATWKVTPDIAFCLDVGIATDTPTISKQKFGTLKLGQGVGIIKNADNNELLTEALINTANINCLPYQITTGSQPTGGTETSRIQLMMKGIPTANIAIPCRYMHSSVEMCDLRDVECGILLLQAEIENLSRSNNHNFNLFK